MEQFNPDIRIVAVDNGHVVVTFDSAAAYDEERSTRAVRIARDFVGMRVALEGFSDATSGEVGNRKKFRGTIKLVVSKADAAEEQFVLAESMLSIAPESKNRKGASLYNFPSGEQVLHAVRQGVAGALSRALAAFYANEGYLDALARSGQIALDVRAVAPAGVPVLPQRNLSMAPVFGAPVAANDPASEDKDKKRFRMKLVAAAIITPLLVYGLLKAGGSMVRSADPIQEAVAKAMVSDPRAVQSQVELTKETLKQMNLDPGKAGDIGCLAAQ
jgi:hypothetical protein